jgi:hypothetical protein
MASWQTLMLGTAKDCLSTLDVLGVRLIDRFRLISTEATVEPLGYATGVSSSSNSGSSTLQDINWNVVLMIRAPR